MAIKKIDDSILTDIADAIRAKNGSTDTMTPPEMPGLIDGLETKAEFKKVKLPPVEQYGAVGYGGGKYVATANNGLAAYSEDGVNWTKTSLPWHGMSQEIAYGNGVYVAAHLGDMIYSTDGINWTVATTPAQDAYRTVSYGNGVFVAGGGMYTIHSTDGINWTQTDTGWLLTNSKAAFGGGKFVAIAHSGYGVGIMYSTDGITWVYMSSDSAGVLDFVGGANAICYGEDKFVVLASHGTQALYSTDGIAWAITTVPAGCYTSVAYGNGVYVGVGARETSSSPSSKYDHPNIEKAIYSTDGINWQEIELPVAQKWVSVCYGDNGFVAISERGVTAYSTDGLTWSEGELPITLTSLYGEHVYTKYVYGDGLYIVADGLQSKEYWSLDGHFWSVSSLPSIGWPISMCYGGGKFVALFSNYVNSTGYTYTLAYAKRTNGTYWTTGNTLSAEAKLCYGLGKFVAVGAGVAWYSEDGINWTEAALPTTNGCVSVCYGRGTFVAIFGGNTAAYSTDGINWTEATLPETDEVWYSLCYGKNRFVAVASGNVAAYSENGSSWTATTQPISWRTHKSVCYGNGKFVAVGYDFDDGTHMPIASPVYVHSEDGINWKEAALPSEMWQNVCDGEGKFLAVWCDLITSESGIAVCDVTKPLK